MAHIVVTPPTSYSTGGIAIPKPAGFANIRAAIVNPRSATNTALWTFDPATQKILAHCTAAAATGLTEATAAGDLSAQVLDVLAFDWDEVEAVTVAAA